jgi:hypothetical protein
VPITIDESQPYLKGISAYIQRKIEPWLRAHEEARSQLVQRRQTTLWAGVGLAVLWPIAMRAKS